MKARNTEGSELSKIQLRSQNRAAMNHRVLLLAIFVVLAGCTGGITAKFPRFDNLKDAAEVYVIRNDNIWGAALPAKVVYQGFIIAHLYTSEYIQLKLPPGSHSIGMTVASLNLELERGRKYYFLISPPPGGHGFEIERISEAEGENWLKKSENQTGKFLK